MTEHKRFGWFGPLLAGTMLVTGVYILFTALGPWLPDVPVIGLQKADITAKLSETQPGGQGNRLYIPQLGIDIAIVEGTDARVLDNGAWHRQPQNGNPERGGNFIISAHRFSLGWTPQQTRAKSPFYQIDKLQPGDQFFVDWNGARYAYKVARLYDVPKTAVEIEGPSDTPKLTLYSCDLRGESAGRVVVEAEPLGTF